ncbi:MAG: RHS repeat-associated protein [Luteibaculaceae bacterium]|jgi:RHS repeat-associated protein
MAGLMDYYPFGMIMPGRQFSSKSYRYGFQGQEKDDEIKGVGNSVNYKYRMHDTRLGRFFAVDPLAPKYAHNSPYAFSENRVIDGVELEGLEWSSSKSTNSDGTTVIKLTIDLKVKNNTGTIGNGIDTDEFLIGANKIKTSTEALLSKTEGGVKYEVTINLQFSKEIDAQGGYSSIDESDFVLSFEDKVFDKNGNAAAGKVDEIGNTQVNTIKVTPFEAYDGYYTGERVPLDQLGETGAHELGHTGGLFHRRDEKDPLF